MTAPVLATVHVRRSPEVAFYVFTTRIGDWWPLATHGCFGDQAAGLSFSDGRLVELSVDGDTEVWGEVLEWDPPRRFACTWHPGATDGAHAVVEVDFRPDEDGTRVELAHRGWEAFGTDADRRRSAYEAPDGWAKVLELFAVAVHIETER